MLTKSSPVAQFHEEGSNVWSDFWVYFIGVGLVDGHERWHLINL